MRRLLTYLVLPIALAGYVQAQTLPLVQAVAVTPEPANRLAPGQNLYVRVAYESGQPLRFQAAGYNQGQKHASLAMNPSPVYSAGKGETVVWLFGQPGARIDEVRIRVCDANWQQLSEVPVKVAAEWRAGVPPAPEAPWATELAAAQQRAVSQAMQEEPVATTLYEKIWFALVAALVPLAFLCVPGYPILQAYTLWRLRGPARLLAAIPLAFMLPVYAFCLYALSQDGNLWPLPAIFASPLAFVLTLVVLLVARRKAPAA